MTTQHEKALRFQALHRGPAAFVNAVMDAIKETGVRNIDMPLLPGRVYEALTERHDISGMPPVRMDD